MPKNSKGKGWFGNSEAHAKAGRKGGLARGKKNKENATASSIDQNYNS